MSQQPIGIFDSGLGGLSVWQAVQRLLPEEPLIYVADSQFCPYGPRTLAEVQRLSEGIVRFLLSKGCKLIVVACNTATAAAIQVLRAQYEVPFVGMEPALKPAAEATQTGVIGVLATRRTLAGGHFRRSLERFAPHLDVQAREGQGLVELVEHGEVYSTEAYLLLQRYLKPMLQAGADQIVLGCSHYPFLTPVMEKIVAGAAHIIDPAPAIARQAARRLQQEGLTAPPGLDFRYECYSTGSLTGLSGLMRSIVPAAVYDRCDFWRVEIER